MPREQGRTVLAVNRRARHDYMIEETYEAGLVLSGGEVKSLRLGRVSLVDGYGFIDAAEAWLDAVHIAEYAGGVWKDDSPRRRRKLLLHKKQILKIDAQINRGGYTLIPLSIYFSDGRAKVEIAVAKGKREYDKRRDDWEREDARAAQRALSAHRRSQVDPQL